MPYLMTDRSEDFSVSQKIQQAAEDHHIRLVMAEGEGVGYRIVRDVRRRLRHIWDSASLAQRALQARIPMLAYALLALPTLNRYSGRS